jgi:signal transduction histidine kinase
MAGGGRPPPAKALETENEYRKQLEGALRDALRQRQAAEAALKQREEDRQRAEADRERLLFAEQAARAEAEKASRLKDEFLAVLSHELRTPLNAIVGWAHIVGDRRTDPDMVQRALEVIRRNAMLQLHLIDDLLDVSRIVTGKMQLALDRTDLFPVVTAAIESVRPSASTKGIEVEMRADDSARFVMGDAGRLQQVTWNLLSNAVKFTPAHGRIEVSIERVGNYAQLSVRDNGQGIASEFLPFVFDRFRQADTSTTRKNGGLGLGLAVVRYLIEAHGGTVAASSAGESRGATFTVRLPLCADVVMNDGVAEEECRGANGHYVATPLEGDIALASGPEYPTRTAAWGQDPAAPR